MKELFAERFSVCNLEVILMVDVERSKDRCENEGCGKLRVDLVVMR